MADNDFMKYFSTDFAKNFDSYGSFPFDMASLMENQTRNLQAITEAQQLAMEGFQSIAQKQSELVSRMVQDNTTLAQEIMKESTPEQKLAKQADLFKKVYERSMRDMKEISDMISQSNQDASEVLNKRVSASLNEIKSAVKSKGATKKAA